MARHLFRSVGVLLWMVSFFFSLRFPDLRAPLPLASSVDLSRERFLLNRYIRRYGAHFRESTVKTLCAFSIPIVIVLSAWVPPTFLFVRGAREFNEALRVADVVKGTLERWQSTWSPTEGLNLANFMSLFDIGAKMGKALVDYSSNFQIGCLYVATLLTVTLIVSFFFFFLASFSLLEKKKPVN